MTRKAGGNLANHHKVTPTIQRYAALTVQDIKAELQVVTNDLANPLQDINGYPRAKNGKEKSIGSLKLNETPKLAQAKGVFTFMKLGANTKKGVSKEKSQIQLGKRTMQVLGLYMYPTKELISTPYDSLKLGTTGSVPKDQANRSARLNVSLKTHCGSLSAHDQASAGYIRTSSIGVEKQATQVGLEKRDSCTNPSNHAVLLEGPGETSRPQSMLQHEFDLENETCFRVNSPLYKFSYFNTSGNFT